jgi:hypothetical protein
VVYSVCPSDFRDMFDRKTVYTFLSNHSNTVQVLVPPENSVDQNQDLVLLDSS